jgi:hypothetical protein
MKQFAEVYDYYGAPKGRGAYGDSKTTTKIRLFKVSLKQGYDDGGAYWGNGQPLYCAIGAEYRQFIRADSRKEAAEKLEITEKLMRK